jgi:hypothetical protein
MSKRNYKLTCDRCGKEIPIGKKVCLLEINGEVVSDEYGVMEFKFCSKKCALEWRDRNTTFKFIDEGLFNE